MSRVVVIGATGHIGTYLVPRLVRGGHEVIAISRGTRDPYHASREWSSVRRVTGRPLALPDHGLGVLHHVHADDVAQAFERAMSRPTAIGASFHVVAEQAMTLRGLATGVAGWFGREPVLEFTDWAEFERRAGAEHAETTRQHTVRSIAASIDRARQVLVRAAVHLAGRPARGAGLAGRQRPGRRRRPGVLGPRGRRAAARGAGIELLPRAPADSLVP